MRDGPQPYEAKIGLVSEAFGIAPAEAEEQDEELSLRALDAVHAARVVRRAGTPGRELSTDEAETFQSLLNVLDEIDEERGVPEEK